MRSSTGLSLLAALLGLAAIVIFLRVRARLRRTTEVADKRMAEFKQRMAAMPPGLTTEERARYLREAAEDIRRRNPPPSGTAT